MSEPLKVWRSALIDEGLLTAVYPYIQLHEIQRPEDCRRGILEETLPHETEFGSTIVQPLYDLVWTLNRGAGMFTSHTAIAPPNQKPPYDWAKHYVAVAIITLSRNHNDHLSQEACLQTVDELGRIISASAPTQDHTGWYLSVGPCNVIYTSEREGHL